MRKAAFLSFVVVTMSVVGVAAKTTQNTNYKYYSINGNSPGEIYSSMVRRGPDVNGVNAYASTSATSSQSGRLMQGKSCRVEDYKFEIDFTINLPKLRNENALLGSTKSKWNQFKSFLKTHEEHHRTIWLGCARDLEAQIKALRTTNCKGLDAQAANLWKNMRKSCDRKHAAFDAAEQQRLIVHPFVRLVLGNKIHTTHALKTATNN
jgi:predicted secreted Zn-dependent protease